VSGCASSRQDTFPLEYQLPPELQRQVEQRVSFANVKADPAAYKGRIILLGGEVLKAKRLADRTRLEILHLPLNEFNEPVMNRTVSQGRYLAFQKEFLDPATVPPGTRVTVVGEVTGTTEGDLDDMKYSFVTLEIRHLQIWPQAPTPYARDSASSPYYSYSYMYRYLLGSVLVPLLGFLLVLPLLVRRFLHSTPTAGKLTAIHPSPPRTVRCLRI